MTRRRDSGRARAVATGLPQAGQKRAVSGVWTPHAAHTGMERVNRSGVGAVKLGCGRGAAAAQGTA